MTTDTLHFNMKLIFCLLICVNIILSVNSFSGEVMTYSNPGNCNISEYFNPYLLKCLTCNPSKHLQPTKNKLSCTCNSISKVISTDINGFPECEPCPFNEVATSDQRDCIPCIHTDSSSNGTCDPCAANHFTSEREINGMLRDSVDCIQCSNNTTPADDNRSCIPCPFNLIYTGGNHCVCPTKTHEFLDGVCIPRGSMIGDWPDERNTYLIEYDNGEKIESSFFLRHLRSAMYLCFNKNRTSCQILANMCTMVMYRDHYKSSPCRMFQNSKHIPTSESSVLPWIYYGEGDAQTVLSRRKITTKFSLSSHSQTSHLNLTAVHFSADGKFKSVSAAPGSFLQLCPDSWLSLDAGLRVGLRYFHSCRLPAQQLVSLRDTSFMDLYLQYWEAGEAMMYAVPVLVLNAKHQGFHNNQGNDPSQWQLTRRFFLIDKISGVSARSDSLINEEEASVVQFLQSFKLRVRLQNKEEEGRIYPPLLIVKYGLLTQDEIRRNVDVDIDFSVEYEMENSMSHAIEVSLGVLCALAVVWSGIQSWSNSHRSGRVAIDLLTITKLLLFACGNLANAFFFVVVCASVHTFLFYKGQSVIQVLLPSAEQEELVRVYIITAFSLKIVEVVHLIWTQVSVDIFLIDWERPRARNPTVRTGDTTEQPVSVWRAYFVANEWNELQSKRRVNPSVHLLITLFVLCVAGVEGWASAHPEVGASVPRHMEEAPPSVICRLAVGVLVYLFVYMAQWLLVVGVYERYIKNGIQEFVDICSLANISVFILSHENYGYYIHGRSAHGFADTDMQTMLGQLQREEDDLCGHRGLTPGTDQQTFQMSVPYQLRAYYRKVMAPISSALQSNRHFSLAGTGGLRSKMANGIMERSVQSYHSMNKFLAAFLEHALKDLDYEVRDRLFVESLLDIDFLESTERGVLYRDNGHSFDRVLFHGNEFLLASFDLMVFSFVEVLSHNFLLAVIITALSAKILALIRQIGGKKNLAKKTLIDERFLI